MLKKIEIENFKSFKENFIFRLDDVNGYNFNKVSIRNGIVNTSIIYGYNGIGKSNLALAIFDIVSHLSDKEFPNSKYNNYLNGNCDKKLAKFKYEFKFEEDIINYEYNKNDYNTILDEKFLINGNLFASIKRYKENKHILETVAEGCETLNKDLTNSNISIIKYIKSNAVLKDNRENRAFYKFVDFVESMLLFRNLDDRFYIGYKQGGKSLSNEIVKDGHLENFEKFLNDSGIICKLLKRESIEGWGIDVVFDNKKIPFFEIASSGTISLTLFYYWYQKVKENKDCKFLFIDEFDAFYHHSLSKMVVEKLKELYDVQVILSTHNTAIMSNDILRPDCYFFMYKDKIISLSKSTQKELREAHNIEKMYRAGLFGK